MNIMGPKRRHLSDLCFNPDRRDVMQGQAKIRQFQLDEHVKKAVRMEGVRVSFDDCSRRKQRSVLTEIRNPVPRSEDDGTKLLTHTGQLKKNHLGLNLIEMTRI